VKELDEFFSIFPNEPISCDPKEHTVMETPPLLAFHIDSEIHIL
jgi:hypothetical protein